MCVDPEPELQEAYGALIAARFPPEATALFDDVSAVDYATVAGTAARRRCSRRIRWTRRAGRSAWSASFRGAIPARDGAGAGGPMKIQSRRGALTIVALAIVGALLAALLLWPLAEGVRGAFVERPRPADVRVRGHRVPEPDLSRGAAQRARDRRPEHGRRGRPGHRRRPAAPPLRVPGAAAAGGAGAAAADGAAVRGRGRHEAAPRPRRRAERAARTDGARRRARADRLAARGALRGGRRADRAAPLSDRLLQRAGGAGRPQRGDGGGGAQPRLPRLAAVPQDHAALDPAQRVRGGQHRLHLGVHRAGRAADVRLTRA